MNFERLLEIVRDEPIFETGLLLAGESDPDSLRQQLSRWTKTGRLYQLRRGVYTLAPPYQKAKPHPFVIANHLVTGSYVSLQSALAYYGMIPEYTPLTTGVTTSRPGHWETPLGNFAYRHMQPSLLFGYQRLEVSAEQFAFVASPEKALLDLIYLTPHAGESHYLGELRLQNTEHMRFAMLEDFAQRSGQPKLARAVQALTKQLEHAREDFDTL